MGRGGLAFQRSVFVGVVLVGLPLTTRPRGDWVKQGEGVCRCV